MSADINRKCRKCGKSPWAHPLRGGVLYCHDVGEQRSDYTIAEVNAVRACIGKKPVRRKDS